jgi:predicted dehydrogenase
MKDCLLKTKQPASEARSCVLIIGTGSIGQRHLRNLRLLGQTDFCAFRSRRNPPVNRIADVDLRHYFELDDALAEQPKIAIIANPASLHVPLALKVAKRGCHIFLEKPVSNTLDGVQDLIEEVRRKELVVAVGYNLRFHPVLRALRQRLTQAVIGRILSVRAWVGQYLPDWHPNEDYRHSYMTSTELGGGVILTLSHEIDYLYWLFGEVMSVTAVTARAESLQMQTESLAEITLSFRCGVLGQVHLDCLQRKAQRGCELIGTDGTMLVDFMESTIRINRPGIPHQETIGITKEDANQMYVEEMANFLSAVKTGNSPLVSLEDGVAVLKIALAAHRAARSGTQQSCQ